MFVRKVAFGHLHGISVSRVNSLLERSSDSLVAPTDKRGKHKNRPNRVSSAIVSQIDQHIQSFPAKTSHYSRTENISKKYLSEDLSIAKMHRLYLELHEPTVTGELHLGGKPTPVVKYEFYRNRFNTHHNLSFGRPRSDTCPTCDEFSIKIQEQTDATITRERVRTAP